MANLKDLLVNGVTNFIGRVYAQTPTKGTSDRQVATTEFVLDNCYKPPLLSFMWSDHLFNDMSWLRADTFSWQDGTTYSSAYNELLAEYNDSASVEETEGSITFKRTPKGYKIAIADQENAILNKYNSNGIAWYYILDTTNQRFKLPRTKFGFEGLRTNVGDDIEAGLPNITGGTGLGYGVESGSYSLSGALAVGSGYSGSFLTIRGSETNRGYIGFDASKSNPIYGNSNTVQPPATQMYLYFYVGEYTQTAVEQTAGLNAELFNGKMDRDLSNRTSNIHFVTETYQNGASWYRVYSDGWCEQGGYSYPSTATTTFLKQFSNINYTLITQPCDKTGTSGVATYMITLNHTVTQFRAIANVDITGYAWHACGYIK